MSLIRKHGAVLQAWACLALVRPGDSLLSFLVASDVLANSNVTKCKWNRKFKCSTSEYRRHVERSVHTAATCRILHVAAVWTAVSVLVFFLIILISLVLMCSYCFSVYTYLSGRSRINDWLTDWVCIVYCVEAEYAHNLGKPIIPLRIKAGCELDGWLAPLCRTDLLVDFSDPATFDAEIQRLSVQLRSMARIRPPSNNRFEHYATFVSFLPYCTFNLPYPRDCF